MRYKLAVIGVGNMAKAIVNGIQHSDTKISKISLFDKNPQQYSTVSSGICEVSYGQSISDVVESSDIILLSVKPQNFNDVLAEIALVKNHEKKHYITIAAGISIDTVSSALNGAQITRVMPNLPLTVGSGVSAICCSKNTTEENFSLACSLFSSIGSILRIEESDMNKIISVTGSSPAYVLKFINAIYEGACSQGFEPSAELLNAVCDVFIGTAMLLKSSEFSPKELINMVCSKGGTTEKAMMKLDEHDTDNAILQAMLACTQRADELGNISK